MLKIEIISDSPLPRQCAFVLLTGGLLSPSQSDGGPLPMEPGQSLTPSPLERCCVIVNGMVLPGQIKVYS